MTRPSLPTELLHHLQCIVGDDGWLTREQATAPYARDWHGVFDGHTPLVLKPADTQQVSAIARSCARAGVAIVPQGGNTGYAAGAAPSAGQVVVSLERMNRIRDLDTANYTFTVEAGCVLARVQQAARDAGLLFPLSLGAQGSCHIGGNLATNAGGTAVLRYGNARELALGLEVVLPDGRIWNGLRPLRKDNTGYDLRQLFIGAEGTLGIITAAVLKLFPQPAHTATAMVAVPEAAQAVALLDHMRRHSGDLVTAFEYIHGSALRLVDNFVHKNDVPLTAHEHVVLIELSGGAPDADLDATLEQALATACDTGLATDAVMAANLRQRATFWQIREHIPEALRQAGTCIPCDVSVPVSGVPAFLATATQAVDKKCPGIRVVPFGHVGDGNIHFDLLEPEGMDAEAFVARMPDITAVVYDVVQAHAGSFSAEHGIGKLKLDAMRRYRDATELAMLRSIKRAFDPQDLMNPGKVVPDVAD